MELDRVDPGLLTIPALGPLHNCELVTELEPWSKELRLSDGQDLFQEGDKPDRIFIVKGSQPVLVLKADESPLACLTLSSGSIIGLAELVVGRPYPLTGELVGIAEIFEVGALDFWRLVENNPQLWIQILRAIAVQQESLLDALSGSTEDSGPLD